MNITENINFNRVEEMAEGDSEFKSQLLQAIYTSIQDLKKKYMLGASFYKDIFPANILTWILEIYSNTTIMRVLD